MSYLPSAGYIALAMCPPRAPWLTHSNGGWNFAESPLVTLGKDRLWRVFYRDTPQSYRFAECFETTLSKVIIFLSSALQTFSAQHILHVVFHVKIWYISWSIFFILLIYFNKMGDKSNLNCKWPLQEISWSMTIQFHHKSPKNHNKTVFVTISNSVIYWAS